MKRLSLTKSAVLLFCLLILWTLGASVTINALENGEFIERNDGLSYLIFRPSAYSTEPLPLVIMLHGCTQDAFDFARGTQMHLVAERENFIVAFPEQERTTENPERCWDWANPINQRRGSGEPQSIVEVVNHIKTNFNIKDNAVFVTGLSAGGAMSVTLGILYPDVFTAISVSGGVPFQAGVNEWTMWQAMLAGVPAVPPIVAANNGITQVPTNYRRVVPTLVFHGTHDFIVNPLNGDYIISQMLTYNVSSDRTINVFNRIFRGGMVPGGRTYTVDSFRNGRGQTVVQHYRINFMGHYWSGGSNAGSYTDPRGPSASEISWNFFREAMQVR